MITNHTQFLCFGDSDWWYHNHGHMDIQLMRQYARFTKVLYVNSIVLRKFNIHEGKIFLHRLNRKLRSIACGMKPSEIENMTFKKCFDNTGQYKARITCKTMELAKSLKDLPNPEYSIIGVSRGKLDLTRQ